MRNALRLGLVLLTALPVFAGDMRIINATCEDAITKSEVLAARRKWWPERPDPKAPVVNIRTHSNFAKNVLLPLGSLWSHEKVGELLFEERKESCQVVSNGHPADVILSDLGKVEFTSSESASTVGPRQNPKTREATQKPTEKCPNGTYWGDDSSGAPICAWSR